MKPSHFIAAAALALAACGQPAGTGDTQAPAAPQSRMEQVMAMDEANQMVAAYQDLVGYLQSHPELTPPCQNVRRTESLGVVPADVTADSIYASHVGAAVFAVQCGELRSMAPMDPRERWIVIYAPGASSAAVANCADADGRNRCAPLTPPQGAPAPTTP